MPLFIISGNAHGLRTSEVGHAVEHAHTDGDLGRLRVGVPCPQAVIRQPLQAIHRVLRARAPMVAAVLLPFTADESGDRVNRGVAPHRSNILVGQ